MGLFRRLFDHEGKEVGEELLTISQGPCCVAEYALEFWTIAARSEWNEPALKMQWIKPGSINGANLPRQTTHP